MIVGKVIFDTFTRQLFRQGPAEAFLSFGPFRQRQASVQQVDDVVIFNLTGNLFGFIEEAIDLLFAARHKPMQARQGKFFLEFDDAGAQRFLLNFECSDFGSICRQLRYQFCNTRFASSIHQILESKAGRFVNSNHVPSARNLPLSHRMAHHRVDIDAVE